MEPCPSVQGVENLNVKNPGAKLTREGKEGKFPLEFLINFRENRKKKVSNFLLTITADLFDSNQLEKVIEGSKYNQNDQRGKKGKFLLEI